MKPKVFVIGATGTIGKALIPALSSYQVEVIAGVTKASSVADFKTKGIAATVINLSDPDSMIAAFKGVDRLFILVPFDEKMLTFGYNAVDAAVVAGVKFIVRSSAIGAEPSSWFLLGDTHNRIDEKLRKSGIPYSILKPNTFMQNFVNYQADMIRNANAIYSPDGGSRTSYIDTRDIGRCAAAILADPEVHVGKEYGLTGPQALSNSEVAAIIGNVRGAPVKYVPLTADEARKAMLSAGWPVWNVDALLGLSARVREGKTSAVTTTVEELTGREPIKFADFARENASVWKLQTAPQKETERHF